MVHLRWLLVALVALALGAAVLQYLVVPPLQMGIYEAVSLVLLGALVFCLVRYFPRWQLACGLLLAVALFATGYLGANSLFLKQEEGRSLPAITCAPGSGGALRAIRR